MSRGVELLLADTRGIYIPQNFAEEIDLNLHFDVIKGGVTEKQMEVLLNGPTEELYWEVWDEILNGFEGQDAEGNIWTLYQDGDLFLICDALMTLKEKKDFFGLDYDDEEEKPHVIVINSLLSGIQVIGPFKDLREALEFAEQFITDENWEIVGMDEPWK
jgi:hypothetical protein